MEVKVNPVKYSAVLRLSQVPTRECSEDFMIIVECDEPEPFEESLVIRRPMLKGMIKFFLLF